MNSAGRVEWWRTDPAPVNVARFPSAAAEVMPESAGSRAPFRALMAFTFVLMLAPQTFVPALAPLRLGLLTAAVAIAAHLVDRFVSGRPIMKVTP